MKLNAIQNHSHLAHFLLENVPYTVRSIEYQKHRNKSSHLLTVYWVATDCSLIDCLLPSSFLIYDYSVFHQIKVNSFF